MHVELELLAEIADKHMTRDDVAATYALAMNSPEGEMDWPLVNYAIIKRWSPSALKYVKHRAWKLHRGAPE